MEKKKWDVTKYYKKMKTLEKHILGLWFLLWAMNKGNSRISLFNSHKISLNQIQVTKIKTKRNTLTIRGKQLNNRNSDLLQKRTTTFIKMDYFLYLFDSNCHIPKLIQEILRKNGWLYLVVWLAPVYTAIKVTQFKLSTSFLSHIFKLPLFEIVICHVLYYDMYCLMSF